MLTNYIKRKNRTNRQVSVVSDCQEEDHLDKDMSHSVIVLYALVASAVALAPLERAVPAASAVPSQPEIPIVRHNVDGPNPDGTYAYAYETGNGIQAEEQGHLEDIGEDYPAMVVNGFYSYPSEDGTPIQVKYVADANGFRPEGAHIPQIPETIKRALDFIATHRKIEPTEEQ